MISSQTTMKAAAEPRDRHIYIYIYTYKYFIYIYIYFLSSFSIFFLNLLSFNRVRLTLIRAKFHLLATHCLIIMLIYLTIDPWRSYAERVSNSRFDGNEKLPLLFRISGREERSVSPLTFRGRVEIGWGQFLGSRETV